MKRILILTASNPATNPRPRRMIENLKGKFELYAMGIESGEIERVQTFSFPSYKKRNFFQECKLYLDVFLSRWEALIWTQNRLEIVPFLEKHDFEVIICFDLPLLPIALAYKKNAKVIFDAQEYYPLWMTSDKRWNLLFKRFYFELCKTYLPKADLVLSVSPSFVERYAREFMISPMYYPSWPYYYKDLYPKEPTSEIKILYHGSLSCNRSINELIGLSDLLQERFELHLVFVGGDPNYRKKIEAMIEARQKNGKKIFLHPPVAFERIVPFGNAFDIGLYFMPPKTYNLLATIPNKVFEYIGSSLALVSTPNTDVSAIIQEKGIGRVSKDFSIHSVAGAINSLSAKEIYAYKLASHEAHKEFNNAKNSEKIFKLLAY